MPEVKESLSKDKLQELLQIGEIDAGNGMLFGMSEKREPRKTGLTLVVGTGGSGTSAIMEALRLADQKLTPEYRNFVEFILVDSAKDELEKTRKRTGIRTLNISTPGADQRMILKPGQEYRPPFFRRFMPADYDIKNINEDGASRDRTTGKMKLYDISADGSATNDAKFQQMVRSLFNGKWNAYRNLPVDIMILTGISGGNGSGTFIDLAARAKHACLAAGAKTVHVYGYIMLPDTAEHFVNDTKGRLTFYRNGYAALKELESYMSIVFNKDREEVITAPEAVDNVTLSQTNLPFDYPVLISGDYQKAVSMIAETIVNLMGDSGGNFDQASFYSNIQSARAVGMSAKNLCADGILRPGACPEDSHMYCGIGYAHASIPEKIVIPNVISKVCKSLYVAHDYVGLNTAEKGAAFCSSERHLLKAEFERQIGILFGVSNETPITDTCLWDLIAAKLDDLATLPENPNPLDYEDISVGATDTWVSGFKPQTVSKKGQEEISRYLDALYETFESKAVSVMKQYGPRAMQYLYTGEGQVTEHDFSNISIKRILQCVEDNISALSLSGGEHPEPLEAKGLLGRFWADKVKGKVLEWEQAKAQAISDDITTEIAQSMVGANGSWKSEFTDRVECLLNCCIRFADVLELLTTYYSSVGKSLDSDTFVEFSQNGAERNGLNLCSDQNMYNWVKKNVAAKVKAIDLDKVKEKLIQDFMTHSAQWCSPEIGQARARYDEVMSICCELGAFASVENKLNLSIEAYFNAALANVPDTSQNTEIDNLVADIMERLLQKSAPSIHVTSGSWRDTNVNVLIPQSLIRGQYGTQILKSFNAHLGKAPDDNSGVKVSNLVEAVVCYQTSVAHAMSSLKDLPKWEQAYGEMQSSSMHLNNGEYESQYMELTMSEKDQRENLYRQTPVSPEDEKLGSIGLSWLHYPSINLTAYGNNFTRFDSLSSETVEAQYRRNTFDPKVEYALREGIIECDEVGANQYSYHINLIPEDWHNLNVSAYKNRINGRVERGESLFKFLESQNSDSRGTRRKEIKLIGSDFFEHPFDFNRIIQVQHWNESRVTQEHRAYMKRILRKDTALYQELEQTLRRYYDIRKKLEEQEKGYKAYEFCDLYISGCIYTDPNGEIWNLRVNETGGIQNIVTLDWITKMSGELTPLEVQLCGNDMVLPVVYNRYKKMVLSADMGQVKKAWIRIKAQQQPQQLRTEVVSALSQLKTAYEVYYNRFGSKPDPAEEIAKVFGVNVHEMEEIKELILFYRSLLEAWDSNKKMMGITDAELTE